MGSLLDTEKKYAKVKEVNVKLYDKVKRDRELVDSLRADFDVASTSYRRAKAACRRKHEKLLEYRERLWNANEAIGRMKRDLRENAIDRYLISDDGYDRDKLIFDRAVEDLKVMLGSKYPDFDFSEFYEEVAARVKPVSDPVDDLSLEFAEARLSDEEPSDVSDDDGRFLGESGVGQSSRA